MNLSIRRFLGITAGALGLVAAFGGSPYHARHATLDVERAAAAIAHEEDHITAVELGEWIRDRKAGLRVIDLRSAEEFEEYHVPSAERVPIESLAATPFRTADTIVLVSDGGAHAAQGWVFLQALGYRHVYFLRGGLREWLDDVMNPTVATDASPAARASFERASAVSRYFGGVPRLIDTRFESVSVAPSSPEHGASSSKPPVSATAATIKQIRRRGC